MSGAYIMTPETAKDVLQKILADPMVIRCKTMAQMEAIAVGARMIEKANENGAKLHHEMCILQYHAAHKEAALFRDERTLGAIKEALRLIHRDIICRGEGNHERA